MERGEKKEKEERRRSRDRSSTFSLDFSDNRTVGFRQSKRKSLSSRQEVQVEIGNGEFRQTPRGRGFSSTWFYSCLKVIQMVLGFGVGNGCAFQSQRFGTECWIFGMSSDSP